MEGEREVRARRACGRRRRRTGWGCAAARTVHGRRDGQGGTAGPQSSATATASGTGGAWRARRRSGGTGETAERGGRLGRGEKDPIEEAARVLRELVSFYTQ